ncbi:MAG: hypothetical protein ACOH2R_26760 [Pseudomonas sp.]
MTISDAGRSHAELIVAELTAIHEAMESLVGKVAERRRIPHDEVEQLRFELAEMKGRLERGSRYGTVDGAKRPQSALESAFFQPAVSKAKAFLGIRANSHPINARWMEQLMSAQSTIGMPLENLKDHLARTP